MLQKMQYELWLWLCEIWIEEANESGKKDILNRVINVNWRTKEMLRGLCLWPLWGEPWVRGNWVSFWQWVYYYWYISNRLCHATVWRCEWLVLLVSTGAVKSSLDSVLSMSALWCSCSLSLIKSKHFKIGPWYPLWVNRSQHRVRKTSISMVNAHWVWFKF